MLFDRYGGAIVWARVRLLAHFSMSFLTGKSTGNTSFRDAPASAMMGPSFLERGIFLHPLSREQTSSLPHLDLCQGLLAANGVLG